MDFSISDAEVDRVVRDQFHSTYGKSYNGIPQGFNAVPAFIRKVAWLSLIE